jgi:hypothetical protein
MVWIAALVACWLGAFVLLVALMVAAARSDRPTADHIAQLARRGPWLPPLGDHEEAR